MKRNGKADKVREKTTGKKMKSLQTFLSCIFYLIQEAEREGLPFVASALKESLAKISCNESREETAQVFDESLYEAMNVLHHLARLLPKERSDFRKVFKTLQQTLHIDPVEKPLQGIRPLRLLQ